MRLLVQIDKVPHAEVSRLLANTYGGYRANRASPAWQGDIQARIETLLMRMEGWGLVEEGGGR